MPLLKGQAVLRGLLMGPGTSYLLLKGFNPFNRSVRADQAGKRAWNHGSWSGVEWADEAVVPIPVMVTATDRATWLGLHQQLAAALRPVGEETSDVEFRFEWGGSEYVMFGRPRMVEPDIKLTPIGKSYTQAAFVALDPFIYAGVATAVGPLGLPSYSGGLTVPAVKRTNLALNPSLETNADGWSAIGTGAVGARQTSGGYAGPACYRVTGDGSTTVQGMGYGSPTTSPVTGVGTWAARVAARLVTSSGPVTHRVWSRVWHTDGTAVEGPPATVSLTSSFQEFATPPVTSTVGKTAYWVQVFCRCLETGFTTTVDLDAVLIEAGSTTSSYFDGDTADTPAAEYRWTGTAHASASTQISAGLTAPFTVAGVLSSGVATVTNAGTADTGLTIRIDGPVIDPRIIVIPPTGPAQILRLAVTLTAGQWLDIDTKARTVLLNGTASYRGRASGDWPVLPPGASTLRWAASEHNTQATLAATFRSSWW